MKRVITCTLIAVGGFAIAPLAFATETIVLPPDSSFTVDEGASVNRYELQRNATLHVLPGGSTQRIFATGGSQVNIQSGHVGMVGITALTLHNSHAVIDNSTIIGSVDPAQPNATAYGVSLSGTDQASTARISNSTISGVGRGINVAHSAVLDLANTQVDGFAGGPGSGAVPGGAGVVVAGATALIREGSVVSGDKNGVVLFAGVTGTVEQGAKLVLDQSRAAGREGSAIRIFRTASSNETAELEINNGSTLSGGNGVILEVGEEARANVSVNNSQLSGNIVADSTATLNLGLSNYASLTGTIENASTLAIDGTSAWTMTGSSTVDSLALAGGTVNLRGTEGSTGFSRLQLGELSGNGTFILGTDLAGQQGDFLDVSGKASGDHQLLVENTGTDPSAEVSAHQLVHTGEGSTSQFGLVGGQVDFGTFAYELEQRGDDWFLVRKGDTTTPGTRSVTGLFSAAPTVWYGESTTLRGRMGELRNGQEQGGGWLRSYGNKYKVAAGAGASYDQVQQGIAFGADAPLPTSNGQWLVGVMGGYSRSDLDLSGGTSGKVDSFYLGAYTTWLADDGLYIDALIKANRFKNSSDVRMSDGRKAKGDYSNNGIGASVEVGKHIKLDDGWFVEPYTQASTLWVDGASYNLDNGMRASADNADSLLGKVGSHVGRTISLDKGGFVQPYVKVAAAHEFARNNQVKVNGNRFDNDLSGSRIELGAGVAAQVTDTVQVNAGFDYMKGNNIEQPWGVNLGVRYNF
ncbi:autotransporter outer membrane beta-barrel domain-containing protein [Pseudomonas sp. NPDC090233]|uniref:autotransporter outer membrane beta-barrel domain-containing protein n=1 Tax=Pseudomonas sp. NPDC090233 TaxID=3364479 RepID=UPI00383B17A2